MCKYSEIIFIKLITKPENNYFKNNKQKCHRKLENQAERAKLKI
jgi:hypothetical protein